MTKTPVPREEIWRQTYRVRPYLTYLSNDALRSRLGDILRNIYTLTPEGKVGALRPDDGGLLWAEKLCHINCEFYRRNTTLQEHVRPEEIPFNKAALRLVTRNQHLVENVHRKGIFCKYGDERWLSLLRERGELRLSPASYYGENELNTARHDDECRLPVFLSPYDHDLGLLPPAIASALPQRSLATLLHNIPDHYLYCLSASFDFRYFIDFRESKAAAEACLLIHDQDEFERRLVTAVEHALPDWEVSFDAVKYIDPLCFPQQLPATGLDVFLFKHFRFMYQREFRLVAVPPKTWASDAHLYIFIEPLSDISELIKLTDSGPGCTSPGVAGP